MTPYQSILDPLFYEDLPRILPTSLWSMTDERTGRTRLTASSFLKIFYGFLHCQSLWGCCLEIGGSLFFSPFLSVFVILESDKSNWVHICIYLQIFKFVYIYILYTKFVYICIYFIFVYIYKSLTTRHV